MKFTLVTFVALAGAASAISVDAGLVKRQCIGSGSLCYTSTDDPNQPCCDGLICRTQTQPNTNICLPAGKRAEAEDLSERFDEEPRWG